MNVLKRSIAEAEALVHMSRAGMLPAREPYIIAPMLWSMRKYGVFSGAVRAAAVRHKDRTAIIDDRGSLTYRELDESVNRLTNAWREQRRTEQTVGILCRNHRGPLIAAYAASRAGMNLVWLNTSFSRPQLLEVVAREGIDFIVCDDEFRTVVGGTGLETLYTDVAVDKDELGVLLARSSPQAPPAPGRSGRHVLLTSGTTGTPKGALRSEPKGNTVAGALLEKIPFRSHGVMVLGPPVFHTTGVVMTTLSIALGSTVVLRRTFDAQSFVADIEKQQATAISLPPILMQRLLALSDHVLDSYDTSSLQVVFCTGAALPAAVSKAFQDRFGDVIYNVYGSTEVSMATVAQPADVRKYPTSVGRPFSGSQVAVLDDNGKPVRGSAKGRIFVGHHAAFEGYTGGGRKETINGLVATGDVGHFERGRLYIDGRDDDMVICGGDNVYPGEVEELLLGHPAVMDACVLGVPDTEFGHCLRAVLALHSDSLLEADEVRDFVRGQLSEFKVPRDVIFVDEIPRNPSGKVLKRELAGDTLLAATP